MLRRVALLAALLLLSLTAAWGAPERAPQAVFVPLDDRPSTLLFVRQIARIGGGWLRTPPRAWLGRYLIPGNADAIGAWMAGTEATRCADAIVSADMVAYGGLVASRNAQTPLDVALRRLEALDALAGPRRRLEVFAIIPRLSLLTSRREAPYERRLALWATDPDASAPADVPTDVVDEYLRVRARNLAVLMRLLDRVADGRIDRLVIGQDDSAGTGLHAREQAQLRETITARQLGGRVMLVSGADEIGMDLVTGWLARRYGWCPAFRVVYSDPQAATTIPPLESLPLHTAVADHIALAGGRLVATEPTGTRGEEGKAQGASPIVTLFVQTPREKPFALPPASARLQSDRFALALRDAMRRGMRVALADLALVNMADPFLAKAVMARVPLPRLEAYAAWNTPSNKLGTAIAQAVAHSLAARFGDRWSASRALASEQTHQAFLLARFVDDYRYQALVRARFRPETAGLPADADPLLNLFGPVGLKIRLELLAYARRLFDKRFRGHSVWVPGLHRWAALEQAHAECVLPWLRLFEVEVRVALRIIPRPGPTLPPQRNLGPEPSPTEGPLQESR